MPRKRYPYRDRSFRMKLSQFGVDVRFEQKRVCSNQEEITFNTASKNGSWHAYEPVSLDLADEQSIRDKVRQWRGHLSAVEKGGCRKGETIFPGRPSWERFTCSGL